MGIATTVNMVYTGILGLGFREAEIPPGNYPNIMDVFYDQGLIGTKAFSLYLVSRFIDKIDISSSH